MDPPLEQVAGVGSVNVPYKLVQMAWLRSLALPGAFLVVMLFLLPVGALFVDDLGLFRFSTLFGDAYFRHVVAFTYGQAILSSLLSGILGTLAAFLYVEQRSPGLHWCWRLSSVCFAMPTVVVALGFVSIWGVSGWVSQTSTSAGLSSIAETMRSGAVYGWAGILGAHVFFNFPVFFKTVGSALRDSDRMYEKIALSLGASRWMCFRTFTLPRVLPAWISSFWIVFLYCASSFVIVLLLGGGPKFSTIEVALYQAIRVEFDRPTASTLAFIQATCAFLSLWLVLGKKNPLAATVVREPGVVIYRFRSPWIATAVVSAFYLVLAVLIAPLLPILVGGVGHLHRGLINPLWNSIQISATASLLALGIAYPLARLRKFSPRPSEKKGIDLLMGTPVAFSAVFVVFAAWSFYGTAIYELRGAWVAVAAVHAFFALPVVYRPIREALDLAPGEFYLAAAALGASPFARWWRIEFPMIKRALGVAASLAAAYSFGELSAVLVFIDPSFETLPLYIYREMGRYRFDNAAGASFCLLIAISTLYAVLGRKERRSWL